MTVTSPIAIAAVALNLFAGAGFNPQHPTHPTELVLVKGGGQTTVSADFSQVEYFPNLKSKIGFANNLKNEGIANTGSFLQEIGPGLMCGHLEFDHWFKWGDEPVKALTEEYSGTRPIFTDPKPSDWMWTYEQMLGDLNIAMMFQLSGAPAQYQVRQAGKGSRHPEPADAEATAAFVAQWVAQENHPYPVLWTLWNEPGHELASVERREDVTGKVIMAKESKGDFAAREISQRGHAAVTIADLFARYTRHMAQTVSPYTRFGLSSFIAADFNDQKLTSGGNVFFKGVFDTLASKFPDAPVDYVTFNSFNGGWKISLSGTRAVLGNRSDIGPIIFTQYAPGSLKLNEDGAATKDVGTTDATPLEASADMLTDLAQMQRATDLKNVCMSYWVGGPYGFLSDKRDLVTRVRYEVIRLFARLPVLRTRLDLGGADPQQPGLHGLAGINAAKAAVLLWNDGDVTVTAGLDLVGLPPALAANTARGTLSIITEDSGGTETAGYSGGDVTLPPHAVALVEISSGTADPLDRRNPINADDGQTRFLATQSFTDRVKAPCQSEATLPKVSACYDNTGTYGFYDSVRGAAYLGTGKGSNPARLTASYQSLPPQLFAAVSGYPAAQVDATVSFAACGKQVSGSSSGGVMTLDFAAVPANCRIDQTATLTLSMSGAASGTQAEVYLTGDGAQAQALAAPSVPAPTGALPSVAEELVVPPFNKE